jgi:hypothetical protein
MQINLDNRHGAINANKMIYDSYNDFMFSKDRFIFNKLMMRHSIYKMTEDLMGDIVECGVFRGSGVFSWLKLLNMNEPNSTKKVLGFDFFQSDFVKDIEDESDRRSMQQVFDRCDDLVSDDISVSGITQRLGAAGFDSDSYELIEGDISTTSKKFVDARPGFRISILYLDLDVDKPTYDALNSFWDRVVPGGVVVFDEYAYHPWTESNAVDRFIKEKGLKLIKTGIQGPTAYVVK